MNRLAFVRGLWRSRWLWLAAAIVVYLILAGSQLGLPGLHYDEAKEAGVPALELLTTGTVTPFRDAAWTVGGVRLPLMVQDYIGALNVYLALPFLAFTGIGVPNLRLLSLLIGVAALIMAAFTVSYWQTSKSRLAWGGVAVAWLLAASPSFVFWSRQGIFVTNLTQPLTWLCLWQGSRWLATGKPRALVWCALAAGLALYAKLLAAWVILPWLLGMAGVWLWRVRRGDAPRLTLRLFLLALAALLLPMLPMLIFNLQTLGTLSTLLQNAGRSYYGVDNLALIPNAQVRWAQILAALRGDHFWYLGGIFGNPIAPFLVLAGYGAGLYAAPRRMLAAMAIVAVAWVASLFTISDLFITHYALIQPLVVAGAALGLTLWAAPHVDRQKIAVALVASWVLLDARAAWMYHGVLARSGGLGDHSDASYHLAYYLRYNGLGAPVALDWGMDATVRYLTAGTVRPVEIFGYASPDAPDAGFEGRLLPFLTNEDNVYLVHSPGNTVFTGRREVFLAAVVGQGKRIVVDAYFNQRDGTPLFEVWRVVAQ